MKRLHEYFCLGAISLAAGTAPANRKPIAYAQILAATLATAQSLALSGQANYVVIQCEGTTSDSVRWRDDGTAPTTTVGMQLIGGQEMDYFGDLSQIQFIAAAGSPILNYTIYT